KWGRTPFRGRKAGLDPSFRTKKGVEPRRLSPSTGCPAARKSRRSGPAGRCGVLSRRRRRWHEGAGRESSCEARHRGSSPILEQQLHRILLPGREAVRNAFVVDSVQGEEPLAVDLHELVVP